MGKRGNYKEGLDVILLGEAVPRGMYVKAKLIGIMLMKDNGEIDDKLLAVTEGSVFENINKISELQSQFPGTLSILKTWFTNYKGVGEDMKINGFAEKEKAEKILNNAIKDYKKYN